ncbi:copper resistance protein CopC [Erythrobacter sp. NE805]|uniref:copper resistance protein CopC n=1 Tax=Erythrobacter sp. NE805 TaxID=3389875 RepID=UPI00396B42F2
MRIAPLLAALALTVLAPAAASAHVALTASSPKAGASAKAAKTITLTFSEPVKPAAASASIVMTAMPGMKDHPEMLIKSFTPAWSADGKTLTLTLAKPLPAGTYEVRWQAAGADGHKASGKVGFTVG